MDLTDQRSTAKSSGIEMFDPHDVPRPVVAIAAELVSLGFQHPPHHHRKAQLILALRGLITCEVANSLWMVPAKCALWIPGGAEHSVRGIGDLALCMLFIEPDAVPAMPSECCTLSVAPLLRELVIRASTLQPLYDCDGADGRLSRTMLDELAAAPIERFYLPLPSDPRLRRIANALAVNPSDRATVGEWAHRVATSERTLSRLINREVGMSFGRWRQQLQIMVALERLAQGESVQLVAFELGFESASAFITMFKRALGVPPGKYLAERRVRTAAGSRHRGLSS